MSRHGSSIVNFQKRGSIMILISEVHGIYLYVKNTIILYHGTCPKTQYYRATFF